MGDAVLGAERERVGGQGAEQMNTDGEELPLGLRHEEPAPASSALATSAAPAAGVHVKKIQAVKKPKRVPMQNPYTARVTFTARAASSGQLIPGS